MTIKMFREWIVFLILTVLGTILALIATTKCNMSDPRDCHSWPFAAASFIFPLLMLVVSRESLIPRLTRAFASAVYWFIAYSVFVDYQHRPWFAQVLPGGCDGPCFGWYTFEFDPPYIVLLILSGIAILIGVGVYLSIRGVLWLV